MTMTDVYEVMDEAFPGAVESTPNGVEVGPFRITSGSGIAGRGDIWALTFPGIPEINPICGLRTKAQLRRAMRDLIVDIINTGDAIRKLYGF